MTKEYEVDGFIMGPTTQEQSMGYDMEKFKYTEYEWEVGRETRYVLKYHKSVNGELEVHTPSYTSWRNADREWIRLKEMPGVQNLEFYVEHTKTVESRQRIA